MRRNCKILEKPNTIVLRICRCAIFFFLFFISIPFYTITNDLKALKSNHSDFFLLILYLSHFVVHTSVISVIVSLFFLVVWIVLSAKLSLRKRDSSKNPHTFHFAAQKYYNVSFFSYEFQMGFWNKNAINNLFTIL